MGWAIKPGTVYRFFTRPLKCIGGCQYSHRVFAHPYWSHLLSINLLKSFYTGLLASLAAVMIFSSGCETDPAFWPAHGLTTADTAAMPHFTVHDQRASNVALRAGHCGSNAPMCNRVPGVALQSVSFEPRVVPGKGAAEGSGRTPLAELEANLADILSPPGRSLRTMSHTEWQYPRVFTQVSMKVRLLN